MSKHGDHVRKLSTLQWHNYRFWWALLQFTESEHFGKGDKNISAGTKTGHSKRALIGDIEFQAYSRTKLNIVTNPPSLLFSSTFSILFIRILFPQRSD